MTEIKFTKKGMPIISDEVIEKLYSNRAEWDSRVRNSLDVLRSEDPHLIGYLNGQLNKYSPEIREILAQELIGLYRILEMQSEENISKSS